MILSICNEPGTLNIIRIVVLLINIIKIVVPIILIVFLVIKIMGAVTKQNQDEIAKTIKSSIPNIIAAVLIFLIPTLVDIVARLSFPNSDYAKCISGISNEKINDLYIDNEDELINIALEKKTYATYYSAFGYLKNIKDKDKRKEYEDILAQLLAEIDELNKPVEPEYPQSTSTGLGNDIVAQKELIEACKWILHDDELQIRLQTCPPGPYKYTNAEQELPGGAVDISTGQASALKNISLHEYQKGVFFGEEKIEVSPDSRYAFMIIYKTVFLHNTVWRAINNKVTIGDFKEIYYNAGSCSQNYRNSLRVSIYDSGAHKAEIDDAVEKTRYLVLANKDGTTTDARYHSYTGIEQQIEAAGAQGKTYVEILENVINSGNDDSTITKMQEYMTVETYMIMAHLKFLITIIKITFMTIFKSKKEKIFFLFLSTKFFFSLHCILHIWINC